MRTWWPAVSIRSRARKVCEMNGVMDRLVRETIDGTALEWALLRRARTARLERYDEAEAYVEGIARFRRSFAARVSGRQEESLIISTRGKAVPRRLRFSLTGPILCSLGVCPSNRCLGS